MQNIIKGDAYEKYIRNYVDTFKDVSYVWLWKNIPDQVLFDNGLITDFNIHRLNRLKSKNDNGLAFGKFASLSSFHSL